MEKIKATFVRNHISETWEMARRGPVGVESHGKTEFVILTLADFELLTQARKPRQPGFAKHLFEGVDINEVLATPIPGIEEYM